MNKMERILTSKELSLTEEVKKIQFVNCVKKRIVEIQKTFYKEINSKKFKQTLSQIKGLEQKLLKTLN